MRAVSAKICFKVEQKIAITHDHCDIVFGLNGLRLKLAPLKNGSVIRTLKYKFIYSHKGLTKKSSTFLTPGKHIKIDPLW